MDSLGKHLRDRLQDAARSAGRQHELKLNIHRQTDCSQVQIKNRLSEYWNISTYKVVTRPSKITMFLFHVRILKHITSSQLRCSDGRKKPSLDCWNNVTIICISVHGGASVFGQPPFVSLSNFKSVVIKKFLSALIHRAQSAFSSTHTEPEEQGSNLLHTNTLNITSVKLEHQELQLSHNQISGQYFGSEVKKGCRAMKSDLQLMFEHRYLFVFRFSFRCKPVALVPSGVWMWRHCK